MNTLQYTSTLNTRLPTQNGAEQSSEVYKETGFHAECACNTED